MKRNSHISVWNLLLIPNFLQKKTFIVFFFFLSPLVILNFDVLANIPSTSSYVFDVHITELLNKYIGFNLSPFIHLSHFAIVYESIGAN